MNRRSSKLSLSAAALATLVVAAPSLAADLTGAGATFPYPIYAKWAEAYKQQTGIGLNYQSIGSGGGIKQIEAKTVDFGASDMPLDPQKLDADGLIQWPTVMGGVVPVVNVKGITAGQIKMDGTTLADIYLGKIKKWNDPELARLNPGVNLPAEPIYVVHRADGSGTTFIFTHYLSQVSPDWKQKVGENTSVEWPTGVGGKGNEGVSSYTSKINGGIGYVEYAYALQNKMPYVMMKNSAGKYVKPASESFQAAAAGADWAHAPGFHLLLTDQPGDESWPITGATFILFYKQQTNCDTAQSVLKFFDWAYKNGDSMAESLDYVPMPDKVTALVEDVWKSKITCDGKPIWPAR